ncbi:MDR family MFS transporter [Crocinitomix algicola]|uniref:MDR family MFS transporter n=1 Tax=Crocinitomix algicola TaxID=1740263 RepID=UPI000830B889|nr:MFS transporter [Crocinitomix algicola]
MKHLFNLYINSFKGLSPEVWWLALITLINRAGTMVVPFLSLYLTEDLKFTLPQVGWIMSAFGLGSVVGSWIGGKLTNHIGGYRTMILSLVGSGFLFIGVQFLHTFNTLLIGIFLVMLVADMFRPAMFVALSAYSKPENKTRSITLIRLAINLGFAGGPAVGGLIITAIGYGGLFWVDGLTCIFAGLLILKILNPKRAPSMDDVSPNHSASPYKDGVFLLFILAMCVFGLAFMQFFSTIPIYYKDVHVLTEFEIGLLFGANGFLIFLVEMPLVKYFEDRKTSTIRLMIIGALMVGFSFVLLNFTSWSGIVVISVLLITMGEIIAFPFSNSFAMNRANRGNKGEYMALYTIAFSFAHIFSHNGGLQLIDKLGFYTTWFLIGGLGLIAVFLLLVVKHALKTEEQVDLQRTTSKPL